MLLKIAPDLTREDLQDIADLCAGGSVDGVDRRKSRQLDIEDLAGAETRHQRKIAAVGQHAGAGERRSKSSGSAEDNHYRLKDLIMGVITSVPFQMDFSLL